MQNSNWILLSTYTFQVSLNLSSPSAKDAGSLTSVTGPWKFKFWLSVWDDGEISRINWGNRFLSLNVNINWEFIGIRLLFFYVYKNGQQWNSSLKDVEQKVNRKSSKWQAIKIKMRIKRGIKCSGVIVEIFRPQAAASLGFSLDFLPDDEAALHQLSSLHKPPSKPKKKPPTQHNTPLPYNPQQQHERTSLPLPPPPSLF